MTRYAIVTHHGESISVYSLVDTLAPEEEQPCVVNTYRTRTEAEVERDYKNAAWLSSEYAAARALFGFSASEAVRGIPEGASYAKVAEVVMVQCLGAITIRPALIAPNPSGNVLHVRKPRS